MSELLKRGKDVIREQPFSVLLGAELIAWEEGSAELALKVREELKQQHGFVHGGAVSYLADNCLTFAGASTLGNSVTSEYKINYLRPAIGDALIAKATVLSSGKRQAVCECKVYAQGDKGEVLVAVAQGTIAKV
ncbi:PaaI family thioesterase [Aurantivibrio infirmus]